MLFEISGFNLDLIKAAGVHSGPFGWSLTFFFVTKVKGKRFQCPTIGRIASQTANRIRRVILSGIIFGLGPWLSG